MVVASTIARKNHFNTSHPQTHDFKILLSAPQIVFWQFLYCGIAHHRVLKKIKHLKYSKNFLCL